MTIMQIPVTKSKGFITIDTEKDIPDDVYEEVVRLGLKVLANRGTSKITKTTYPNEAELKVAAQAKADEQVELIRTSKIKFSGGKAKKSGLPAAVMTEARRLAKNVVKDELKKRGEKISHYAAKDITAAANQLLESDPSFIEMAKENLAAREATPSKLDIGSLLKASPELVKKAEAKKAKASGTLSAKQAGKTAPRAKGKGKFAQASA